MSGDESAEDPAIEREWSSFGAAAAAARAEWREEQEALADEAAIAIRHRTSLRDVLRASMRNGDRLTVAVAGHEFVGCAIEVGEDLLSLRTVSGGRIDIRCDGNVRMQFSVMERSVFEPAGDEIQFGTFRSRMLHHESGDSIVSLGTDLSSDALDGRLAVGADHVRVIGRVNEALVSMASVVFVAVRHTR